MNLHLDRIASAFIIALSLMLVGCDVKQWKQNRKQASANAKEEGAILYAVKTVPPMQQFSKLYPNAHYGITRFGGNPGDQRLWADVLLYDRHILTVTMDVTFGSDPVKVASYSAPVFVINEYALAEVLPDGRVHMKTNIENCHTFTDQEWQKLVAANGDFSAIGINLVTNQPLKVLKKHWNSIKPKYSP